MLAAHCGAVWPEWALECELEPEHRGAHCAISGQTGKIGCWGGAVDYWERVAAG